MLIKYEYINGISKALETDCPYGYKCKVASNTCHRCEFFVSIDVINKNIDCSKQEFFNNKDIDYMIKEYHLLKKMIDLFNTLWGNQNNFVNYHPLRLSLDKLFDDLYCKIIKYKPNFKIKG